MVTWEPPETLANWNGGLGGAQHEAALMARTAIATQSALLAALLQTMVACFVRLGCGLASAFGVGPALVVRCCEGGGRSGWRAGRQLASDCDSTNADPRMCRSCRIGLPLMPVCRSNLMAARLRYPPIFMANPISAVVTQTCRYGSLGKGSVCGFRNCHDGSIKPKNSFRVYRVQRSTRGVSVRRFSQRQKHIE